MKSSEAASAPEGPSGIPNITLQQSGVRQAQARLLSRRNLSGEARGEGARYGGHIRAGESGRGSRGRPGSVEHEDVHGAEAFGGGGHSRGEAVMRARISFDADCRGRQLCCDPPGFVAASARNNEIGAFLGQCRRDGESPPTGRRRHEGCFSLNTEVHQDARRAGVNAAAWIRACPEAFT
jgi:hypothetical protein